MGTPVGVPMGACGLPLSPLGVFDYTTDSKGCQGVLSPIDILRVLVVYWIVYQCFFQVIHRLSTDYPQGSLGLIWVNMGFDLDQLFTFG